MRPADGDLDPTNQMVGVVALDRCTGSHYPIGSNDFPSSLCFM
jgi:hypothetical protein